MQETGSRLLAEELFLSFESPEIAEGVAVLQAALARDRIGEYQIQAAIAALHDDAPTAAETDWPQILSWYDDLVELTQNPLAELSRAVAVGAVHGPRSGLQALAGLETRLPNHHRLDAVRAHLLHRAGDPGAAEQHYRSAAERTRSTAERDHLLTPVTRCPSASLICSCAPGCGRSLRTVSNRLQVSEQTFYWWRTKYGTLKDVESLRLLSVSRVRLCGRTIESVLKESPTHGKTTSDPGREEGPDRDERDRRRAQRC